MLAIGVAVLLAAISLLGVAVLVPGVPEVPLERRRPFEQDPASPLTRFAASAVASFERILAGRSLRLFSRNDLEQAGLRLSQAEFLILVAAGACVGFLVGLVAVGPLVGLLLAILAPFVGHLVLSFLSGKRRARFDSQLATRCSSSPEAFAPATVCCAPSMLPPTNPRNPPPRKCVA